MINWFVVSIGATCSHPGGIPIPEKNDPITLVGFGAVEYAMTFPAEFGCTIPVNVVDDEA
jgi:hypothetical protein